MAEKLCTPMIGRGSRRARSSAFNEGVQVPQKDWDAAVRANPALDSKDHAERTEATRKAILGGELSKYRRR